MKQIVFDSKNIVKKKYEDQTVDDTDELVAFDTQLNFIRNIYLEGETKGNSEYVSEIKKKISNYCKQDKIKRRDTSQIICLSSCVELLLEQKLRCYYCTKKMYIIFPYKRQMDQWTLDRIDNNVAHNEDNVCASCLSCNLKKRQKNHDHWKFTKQLKIIKKTG